MKKVIVFTSHGIAYMYYSYNTTHNEQIVVLHKKFIYLG